MKRIHLIIITSIIFITPFLTKGQNISIAASKMNILYLGKANPLDIVVENMKCGSFFITTNNGKIKGTKCKFEIYPENLGTAKIFVKKIKGKDTITLGVKEFRVNSRPDPIAHVIDQTSGFITKHHLKASGGVVGHFAQFDIREYVIISNFTINIIRGKDTIYTQKIEKNRFTKETYDQFSLLKQFDRINIVDIYYNESYEILALDVATGEYVINEKTHKVHLNDIKLIIED